MDASTMTRAVNYATWLNEHTETIETLARIGHLQNAVNWMKAHNVVALYLQIEPESESVKGLTLSGEIYDMENRSIVTALIENHPDYTKENSNATFSMAATADQITSWLDQSMQETEKQKELNENAARLMDALNEIQRDGSRK